MDYSHLTKDEIIEEIKNEYIFIWNLSKELQNDEEIIVEAMKIDPMALGYASQRLQENEKILVMIEDYDINFYKNIGAIDWYKEKMEVLANIRRKKEKDFMEKSIIPNNIKAKKVKF